MRRLGTFFALGSLLAAISPYLQAAPRKSDVSIIPTFVSKPRPNDVAVVIGIEKYRDLPASDFSSSDATLIRDYLVALGYPSRNITLLLNERATRSDIAMVIERWLPNKVKPDSRVVIYYSGHGSPDPVSGKAYLVPYDGNPNYLDYTAYPMTKLYKQLGDLNVSAVMVFLDSCFSGAKGGRTVIAEGARPLVSVVSPLLALSGGVAVLTASQDSQISTSSKELKHGIFTYHLLKAIQAGKKNLADIFDYVRPFVQDDAKALNVEQTPSLTPAFGPSNTQFVLADFSIEAAPPKESAKTNADILAAKEQLRKEQEKLAAERQQWKEEAQRKERELRDKERRAREQLEREKRQLKRERKRQRKQRKKYDNVPPPP